MKKLIAIITILSALQCSFAQKVKTDTLIVKTKIYCSHCNECETCKPHIEEELKLTKGVTSFKVNTETQTITVIYNPKKTNPKKIRESIANSGYDADEVKADPEAVKKLDGCCKKRE